MRRGRSLSRGLGSARAALVMLPAALALWQCRAPTQIALDVRTDVPCVALTGVSIHVAATAEESEVNAPSAITTHCESGRIGRIFFAPGGSTDSSVAVVVSAALGGDPEVCLRSAPSAACIVARRRLSFEPSITRVIPVLLRRSCAGRRCDTLTTCADATTCASSAVSACSSDNVCKLFPDDDDATQAPPVNDSGSDASRFQRCKRARCRRRRRRSR